MSIGHSSHAMREAAANSPSHNGSTACVRDALRRTGRPLSVYALSLETGLKHFQVKLALIHLMETGGVVRLTGPKGVPYYAEYQSPEPKPEPETSRKAGKITIGRGFRWGAGLV